MLRDLLKNRKFLKIIEEALKEGKILDIIVFGSAVRGKERPNDIDLLALYIFKEDSNFSYELRKKLEKADFKVHMSSSTYEKLASPHFLARESILSEGYSFRFKEFVSSALGFTSFFLFRYYLSGLSNSERMKFYYSLYGRGKEKGVLETFNSVKFSDRIILVPTEQEENIKEFLQSKKIKFDKLNFLLPKRLSSYKFLEDK